MKAHKVLFALTLATFFNAAHAECLKVEVRNDDLEISNSVMDALRNSNLSRDDLFRTLRRVSQYESSGCWAGATGNFDGQFVSIGVMQWNFGQGSLQELLKRYKSKFTSESYFLSEVDRLMPINGRKLFADCLERKIGTICKSLVLGKNGSTKLPGDVKSELDSLFNDGVMRQVQLDLFNRAVTSVLSDLDRVYKNKTPKPWQVAWAVDIKTQQGTRFPSDNNIKKIKAELAKLDKESIREWLMSPLTWYSSMCSDRISEGIKHDCKYNLREWPKMIDHAIDEQARGETLLYSQLIARTAQNQNGKYQADAFQRRATIALGKGSVHGSIYSFSD